MDGEELLRRVREASEAVAEAADECRGDEAISGPAWVSLDWAALKMEELHREVQYDVLTAPRIGAPPIPQNAGGDLHRRNIASDA